jgi:hypothetical protein
MSQKLTSKAAAEYIGISPKTLPVWRCNRVPNQPPYHKVRRKIIYFKADLDEYLARCRY